eukprot:2164463-Pyramimonas_sp.AAC.1
MRVSRRLHHCQESPPERQRVKMITMSAVSSTIGRATCALEASLPMRSEAAFSGAAESTRNRNIRQRVHMATGRRSSQVACSLGHREGGSVHKPSDETSSAVEAAANSLQSESEGAFASFDDECPSWTEVAELNLGVLPFAEPLGK